MRTGLTRLATIRRMKYLITYEKRGAQGLFPVTSKTVIEADDIVRASIKAIGNANTNERVKSIASIE